MYVLESFAVPSQESFQRLVELARLVARAAPRRARYLRRSIAHADTADGQFFRALTQGDFRSDSELASEFWNGDANDEHYRAERAHFKRLLENSVFLLDLKAAGFSRPARDNFHRERWLFLSRVLFLLGPRAAAAGYARKLLKHSLRHEDWAVGLAVLPGLRTYSSWQGDASAFEHYRDLYVRLLETEGAEQEAKAVIERLNASSSKTGAEQSQLAQETEAYLARLQSNFERFRTFSLASSRFDLTTGVLQIRQEYEGALRATEEFEALLRTDYASFVTRSLLGRVAFKRAHCLLQLSRNEEALEAVSEAEEYFPEGSNNWFGSREQAFLAFMRSGRFAEADAIRRSVTEHERFREQPGHRTERWEVYSLYADFVMGRTARITEPERMAKELSVLTKDKRGYYAALLVLELLLYIERGQFARFDERLDTVKKYRSRYLDPEEGDYQLDTFLRLLAKLRVAEYDAGKAAQKGEKLYQGLLRSYESSVSGMQTLTYDWLWRHILEKLRLRTSR